MVCKSTMDGQTDRQMDRRMDEPTDGWADGRMDGQTDLLIEMQGLTAVNAKNCVWA